MLFPLAAPLRRCILTAVVALHLLATPPSSRTRNTGVRAVGRGFIGVAHGFPTGPWTMRTMVRSVGGGVPQGSSGMNDVPTSLFFAAPPPVRLLPQLLPTTKMKSTKDHRRLPTRSFSRFDAMGERDDILGGVSGATPTTGAERASTRDVATTTGVQVVRPNEPFRDTGPDEVSVASFNALAPSYNSLGLPEESRADFESSDRRQRVPMALAMAKRVNADVLCLQEVELMWGRRGDVDGEGDVGDGDKLNLQESAEATLRQLLSSPERVSIRIDDGGDDCITSSPDGLPPSLAAASKSTKTVTVRGYDEFLWCPMHPGRAYDPVGLCVAWRSDRHELVSYRGFRRGMVVQLAEKVGTQRKEQEGHSRHVSGSAVNGSASTAERSSKAAAAAGVVSGVHGPTFCVGNVHLPAKPRDVMGRITVCSAAIRHIEDLSLRRRRVSLGASENYWDSALDGTAFLAGDFNCAIDSPSVNLLTRGYVKSGVPLEDRNYRHRALTKTEAYRLRHYRYRFRDPYGGDGGKLRKVAAPVTVSLAGRGPGVTDHVLFSPPGGGGDGRATATQRSTAYPLHWQVKSGSGAEDETEMGTGAGIGNARNPLLAHRGSLGRRRRRRMRLRQLEARPPGLGPARRRRRLRVDAVLATVDPTDPDRTSAIQSGLPDADGGFPSDHLAVGALFSPAPPLPPLPAPLGTVAWEGPSLTPTRSTDAFPARSPSAHVTRRRHDALVRAVTSWLVSRGATDFIRDKPLYEWKWVQSLKEADSDGGSGHRLRKRSRAPDLCCVSRFPKAFGYRSDQVGPSSAFSSSLLSLKDKDALLSIRDKAGVDGNDGCDGALIMVEITVVTNGGDEAARSVRRRKRRKYRDLSPALSASPVVMQERLSVPPPFVIVVPATGTQLPRETEEVLECLALLTSKNRSCYDGKGGDGDGVCGSIIVHDEAKKMALDLLRIRDHWNGANESRKLTPQARK